jgi:hypothetical protein
MPVILTVERKGAKARMFLALVYAILIMGGITMIWPFLVMVSASFTGPYDYHRYSPVVRAFWDRPDRFMRHISSCFERFPVELYPDAPGQWGSWIVVSRDEAGCDKFAKQQLSSVDDPETFKLWQQASADYALFNLDYDPYNSVCNYDSRHIASFVRNHFEERLKEKESHSIALQLPAARRDAALNLLNEEWLIRYRSFFGIRMVAEKRAPLHHAGWDYPLDNPKFELFQEFKKAYRQLEFEPGCLSWSEYAARAGGKNATNWAAFKKYAADVSPMTSSMPYPSRRLWLKYLNLPDTLEQLGLSKEGALTPMLYASVAGHGCNSLENLPFPPPLQMSSPLLKGVWSNFISHSYPRRLLRVMVSPELESQYQGYAE